MRTPSRPLIGLVLALMFSTVIAQSTTHNLGFSYVQRGELLYDNATRYGSSITHADSVWSALGRITIRPRDYYGPVTVNWLEYTSTTDGWCAYQNYGNIYLNRHYYDASSTTATNRNQCSAHELGHTIGIGDHYGSTYNQQLMYHCPACTSASNPQSHDRADFNAIPNHQFGL